MRDINEPEKPWEKANGEDPQEPQPDKKNSV
jgi:hypothetical protein